MDESMAAVVGAAIQAPGWPDLREGWNDRLQAQLSDADKESAHDNSPTGALTQALAQARCLGPDVPHHNLALLMVGEQSPCGLAGLPAPTVWNHQLGFSEALRLALGLTGRPEIDAVVLLCRGEGSTVAFVLRRPREAWRAELPCYALLALVGEQASPSFGMQLSVGMPRPLSSANGACWLDQHPEETAPPLQARLFLELLLSVHDRILPPTRSACERPIPFTHLATARPWFGGHDLRRRQALWKCGELELLLREPPASPRRYADRWPFELFLLTGRSRPELIDRIVATQSALQNCSHLSDLAYGLADQLHGTHRLAIVAAGRPSLAKALATAAERLADPQCVKLGLASGIFYEQTAQELPRLAVVFPGQGAQYPNMLADVCLALPSMQAWFDRFDEESSPAHPAPSEFLFPIPGCFRDHDPQQLLMGEEGAEAISVAAIGLQDLWERMGLVPDAIVGYSIGELSALISAGLFLVARRGLVRLMSELTRERTPGGCTNYPSIAVTSNDRDLLDRVVREHPGEIFVALDSCPSQIVLSGQSQAIEAATLTLRQGGGTVLPLRFDRGYHTPLYTAKAERIRGLYERVPVGAARTPVYSCIALDWFPETASEVRELAVSQWVKPVRFREAAIALHDQGFHVFLEVGPGSRLTGFLRDSLRGRKHKALSSDAQDRSGLRQLLVSYAQLFVMGFPLNAAPLFAERRVQWPEALGKRPGSTVPAVRPNKPEAPLSPVSVASSGSAHLDLLRGHLQLMDEFLAHQARVHDLLRGGPSEPRVDSAPASSNEWEDLLGAAVQRTPECAIWKLLYNLESLPLLSHHTLGGRPSEREASLSPLPVLPFAFAIELMAQAAQNICGGELSELQEVRGLRWLALDGSDLRLTMRAKRGDEGTAQLELYECRGDEEILAYTARALTSSGLPAPPPPLALELETREGFKVSGAAFYSFVFHGHAFQGIRGLTAIGKAGAEAEMVVGDPRQLVQRASQSHFLSNPVLQDCAGQLVGFWLLEQHGLVDIGLYPYRLGRLRRFGPEPPAGSKVICRASIRFDGRCTEADLDLMLGDTVFARIEGFESRLFRFPPEVFRTLFAIDHNCYLSRQVVLGSVPLSLISGLSQELFDSSWGIWRRALAQVTLTQTERRAWLEVPADQGTSWLLQRLAVKDAVRRWAADQGLLLLPADIDCGVDGQTLGGAALELLEPLPPIAAVAVGTFAVAALSPDGFGIGLASFDDDADTGARQAAAQAWGTAVEDWKVSAGPSPKDTLRLTRGEDSAEVLLDATSTERGIALAMSHQEGTGHDTPSRDRERHLRDRERDDRRLGSRA
jgi:malonyl CoA-acyl carrier protein transacylase